MATVIVTEDNFDKEVINSDVPVLVDFWLARSKQCTDVNRALESISSRLGQRVKIALVNVNDDPDLAYRYKINSVPTMLMFRRGKVTDSIRGALSEKQIERLLN